jgi:tetratricopeptide (TPR) repeat protein
MKFRYTLVAALVALIVLLMGRRFLESFRAPSGPARTQTPDGLGGDGSTFAPGPAPAEQAAVPSLTRSPWAARNKAGIGALEKDAFEEAAEHFAACLAARPDEAVYAHNLAETYARWAMSLHAGDSWDRTRSIELLQQAVDLHPERLDLSDLLDRYRRSEEVEEGFFTRHTLHFEVAFDLNRTEVRADVQTLVLALEDAYLEYGERFGMRPADHGQPIRVVIYTQEGFSAVTQVGAWAGGVYDGAIRVPVADLSRELVRVVSVLRHELLHAFVHEAGGTSVPGWLNEGLAQWLERGRQGPAAGDLERARKAMGSERPFPLDQLRGSLAKWEDPKAIERAYAQSLLLVAHIESHFGAHLLQEMIEGGLQGVSPRAVFKARVGLELDSLLEDVFPPR